MTEMICFTCPCCGECYKLELECLPHGTKLFCQVCRKKLIILNDRVEIYGFETAAGEQSHWICCPHCMTEQEYPWTDRGLYRCNVCSKTYFVSSRMPPLPFRSSPEVRNVPPASPPVSAHAPTVVFDVSPAFAGASPAVKLNIPSCPDPAPAPEAMPSPGVKLNIPTPKETMPGPSPGVKLNIPTPKETMPGPSPAVKLNIPSPPDPAPTPADPLKYRFPSNSASYFKNK